MRVSAVARLGAGWQLVFPHVPHGKLDVFSLVIMVYVLFV